RLRTVNSGVDPSFDAGLPVGLGSSGLSVQTDADLEAFIRQTLDGLGLGLNVQGLLASVLRGTSGKVAISWPGGSAQSNTLTVAHGLTDASGNGVVPSKVLCSMGGEQGRTFADALEGTFTATQFQVSAYSASLTPIAGATDHVTWVALP